MFRIRKVARTELPAIAAALRPSDAAEARAMGYTPLGFLQVAYDTGEYFHAVEHDKHGVVAVSGLAPSEFDCIKCCWMLNTVALESCRMEYLRESRWLWEFGFKEANTDRLGNYIWVHSEDHIKWLRWCGAQIDTEVTMINGEPFYFFIMNKEDLKCH